MCWCLFRQRSDIARTVDFDDPFIFGFSRFDPCQSLECPALFQLLHDRAKAIGGLGMPHPHIVFQVARIVNYACSSHLNPSDA